MNAEASRRPMHRYETDAGDEFNPVWWAGREPADRVLIFVQGFGAPQSDYEGLLEVLRASSGADVYAPQFGAEELLSADDPNAVTTDLADRFNEHVAGYKEVQFVAHSMGTPFLRDAFLKSLGTPTDPTPLRNLLGREGVRITFLAGTSRGYTPSGVWQTVRIDLLLRRWFWLTLATVALAWSIRAALPAVDVPATYFWWVSGLLGVYTIIALVCAYLFSAPSRSGVQWLPLAAALWMLWACIGWPPLFGVALVFQTIGTFMTARLLARLRRDVFAMTALSFIVGAAAPWISAHPVYVWPATLVVLLSLAIFPMRSRLLLEHVLYGSSWITGVRLRWIKTFAPGSGLKPPPVVHLFGEEDRLVGDDDHVELHHHSDALEVAIRGVAHNDFQLSLPQLERKRSLVAQQGVRRSRRDAFAPALLEVLRRAVGDHPHDRLRELCDRTRPAAKAVTVSDDEPTAFRLIQPVQVHKRAAASSFASTHVAQPEFAVFLLHGIHNFAGWEDSLAAKCREAAGDNGLRLIDPVHVRYACCDAIQFLLSSEHDRATRSFLDLYTQTKARYPKAVCVAAAHGSGTYVVANALKNNESVELERLYLAGSVLSRDFDWSMVGPNRPPDQDLCGVVRERIRSDRAAQDWPVGVLCCLLAGLGRLPVLGDFCRSLGTAGVYGFRKRNDARGNEFVFENAYLPGPHGEALNAKYHAEIAAFLLTGQPLQTAHLLAKSPDRRTLRGIMAPTVAGIVAIAAAFVAPAIFGPQGAAWGIAVGGLTLLIVVRIATAA